MTTTPSTPSTRPLPASYRQTTSGLEHRCSRCQRWLPATSVHFTMDRGSRMGVGGYCLACNRRGMRAWQIANPAAANAQATRRHVRDKAIPGILTTDDRELLHAMSGSRCMCCGLHSILVGTLEFDHVLPTSDPRCSHGIENRQLLCSRCNKRKARKIADYRGAWRTRQVAA